jgi:hypothetical protein
MAGNPGKKIRDAPRGTKAEEISGALAALKRDEEAGKGLQ